MDTRSDMPILAGSLSGELEALARKHQVPGAQLAIHYGGITATAQTGELEYGTGRLVTTDAAFPVGSITKCFTATVAMILAADGDIDLDDPVSECMPELGELGEQLTLRQLLSHTSGLAASHGRGEAPAATLRRHVLDHICREDLVLPPGAGFSYSNSGYALTGQLIEAVTGMPWAQALEMILLRPLGIIPVLVGPVADDPMAASTGTASTGAVSTGTASTGAAGAGGGALPAAAPRPVATGHAVTAGRTVPVRQGRTVADAPAGALAVSAADLVALGLLHVGAGEPHLLPPAVAATMREPVPGVLPFGLADGWGLGLAVWKGDGTGGGAWTGHDGNGDGTACYLRISPADGCVIAMTANAGTGGALWHDLLGELAARGIPVPRAADPALAAAAPAPVPCGLAGQYANGELEFTVTEAGGSVYLAVDGNSEAALTFHEDLAFSVIDPVTRRRVFGGRFVPDPVTGEITGMQAGGRFARRLEPAPAGAANCSPRGASALI